MVTHDTVPEGAQASITTTETDLDALGARLQVWLSEQLGAEVTVSNLARPGHSGMSSVSVLFDAAWTADGEQHTAELVARLAPETAAVPVFPGYDLQRQYDVMAGVSAHSEIPVPRARWVNTSDDVLGAPFLVMDRLAGDVPVDNPPYVFDGWLLRMDPAEQRVLQDASVDVLAHLHAIEDPTTVFASLAESGARGLRAHFENERAYYEWTRAEDGLSIPVLEDAFAWIEQNWPADLSEDVLCWGDSRVGNIMYEGTTPIGVLDWESAWLAPREMDLGWFLFFHRMFQDLAEVFEMPGLPHLFRPTDVVARYEETSGTTVRDLDFYITYAALRHGIVMSRIHRRRMHFGEVEAPVDPNEYVMHHQLLAGLIDGTYSWSTK